MAEKEQYSTNSTPPSHPYKIFHLDEESDKDLSLEMKKYHNNKCVICCGCITAILLILAVIFLILIVTVFHVKDPILSLNSVTIQGFNMDLLTSSSNFRPGANLTLEADVSVKNPNVATFKYESVKTSVYYDGRVVGEAIAPPGIARARRTVSQNVTVVVLVDRLLGAPRLVSDLISGKLPVNSYTEMIGKVRILKVFRKDVDIGMNCTMVIDLRKESIQDQSCWRQDYH